MNNINTMSAENSMNSVTSAKSANSENPEKLQTQNKWYLHVDLDAFFASVEQLDHPEYRGKPVIVGGKPDDRRSVVSTASYEARKFGVHSAMPTFLAYKLCPQGIFVHGRMQRYAELSHQIMNIFRDYSPDVDQMSIDEAFIDLTGTEMLFGPPQETAAKIKARVKEETGLTVSAGLAGTKYLAKIASGLSKPDGFFHIQHGNEQNFMLNLPLNKVWGLGPKSLELIKSKGINSTREIFERDFSSLEFLFGTNMATFLYNVVRGIEKESFSRETKTHSISAEATFPYDLTDIYAIETELLELAHGVFFRLLKEESFSRTAFVKIRYDDFSTFTVQETLERNIMTLDSYFEIIKRLFEKRYENGRGIRLLGTGFENITKEEKPYQQDLFSTGNEEKKRAVEKAILNLSKKHPEIKVHKARTLKAIIAFFILLSFSGKSRVFSQESPQQLASKEPPSLFEYDVNDQNHVQLELSGYWQAELSSSFDISFGNNTAPAFSTSLPVFKQDIELSSLIMLNDTWYFSAAFADGFKKNTIEAGYKSDNLIRSAKISNRNITMPKGYSADYFGFGLQGGNNQAPGFSLHIMPQSNKWQADFILRYDMTETKTASFYGMNSISENRIKPSDFLYGREFRFPQNASEILYNLQAVYVEAPDGKYTDKDGKKYKKLNSSEYTYVYSRNRLFLSESAGGGKYTDGFIPSILITFMNDSVESLIQKCGSYDNPDDFLGNIQTSIGGTKYNLQDFSYNLESEIDGSKALKIQSSRGFSPFLCPQNYYIPSHSKTISDADICVIYTQSGTRLTQFTASSIDAAYTSLYEDFFDNSSSQLTQNSLAMTQSYSQSNQNSYIKITLSDKEESPYPFAQLCPQIYLNCECDIDISILAKTYSSEKELNIGKQAAEGTVCVYKNGRLLPDARYNKNTGVVTLTEQISSTDMITITWQEDTVDFSKGAVAAGTGFKFNFTPLLSADISSTVLWPFYVKPEYVDLENKKNSFAAITAGINYEREHLKLSEKASLSVQSENSSKGLYVIKFDDDISKTWYHEQSASKITEKDPEISGYMIPLYIQNDISYTDIKLSAGNLLTNCDELELAIKPDFQFSQAIDTANNTFDVYLVLGIKYGENEEILSSEGKLSALLQDYPYWKLNSKTGLELSKNVWQKISIKLNDSQRSRLTSAHDARLIIQKSSSTQATGRLCIGPYEPVVKSMHTYSSSPITVSEGICRSPDYTEDKTYVSKIRWTKESDDFFSALQAGDNTITASRYFSSADFSSYKSITWTFLSEPEIPFTFKLQSDEATALSLEITDSSFLKTLPENKLHVLKINLQTNKAYIDEAEIPLENYKLYINKKIIPVKLTLTLKTDSLTEETDRGTFYCGNLTYDNSELYLTAQNHASLEYSYEGNIVSIKSFPVIKDLYFSVSSLQTSGKLQSPEFSATSNASAKSTISGLIFEGQLNMQNIQLSSAGHSIKTDSNIIPFISISEKYDYDKSNTSLRKENGILLSTNSEKNPLKFEFATNALKSTYSRQNAYFTFDYSHNFELHSAGITSKLNLSQKRNTQAETQINQNYISGWKDITALAFSDGHLPSDERKESFSTIIKGNLIFTHTEFKPEFGYGLNGYSIKEKILQFTDQTSMNLLLPFSFSNTAIALELSRNGGGTENIITGITKDGSYISDSRKVLELQNERQWFYKQIPFAELFDKNLINKINGNYSTKYELQFKRRLSNSSRDLFIPTSASLALIRDIKTKDLSPLDLYQIKADLSNTSLNNFGKYSSGKLFTWFLQEEIFSNITGIIKIPRNAQSPEDLRFQLTLYLQLILFIQEDAYFTTNLNYGIETASVWSLQNTVSYERPSKSSLTASLLIHFFPDIKKFPMEIKRKDSFELKLEKNAGVFSQSYEYLHSAGHKINKHYTVDTGGGILYSRKSESADILSLKLTLGLKAEF